MVLSQAEPSSTVDGCACALATSWVEFTIVAVISSSWFSNLIAWKVAGNVISWFGVAALQYRLEGLILGNGRDSFVLHETSFLSKFGIVLFCRTSLFDVGP